MPILNNIQLRILSEFLDAPSRPEGTMPLHELRGFLWGIASAPTEIDAEDWLPFVFEGDDPNFRNAEEENTMTDLLLALCDDTFERLENEESPFPTAEYGWHAAADARWPLSAWCSGLLKAHYWQEEQWNTLLQETEPVQTEDGEFDIVEEVETTLDIAALFADTETAMAEAEDPDDLLASLPDIAEQLPWIMMNYAECGRLLFEMLETEDLQPYRREAPKIGRNDPCFCGSGKKYKHCCLNAANDDNI